MSIKRNSIYNLAGALTPLAVTLLTVPHYLAAIGTARYGLLALVWLILGYFSFFDLGLSTATTNALAQGKRNDASDRASILFTSLVVQTALGVTIATCLFLVAPYLLGFLTRFDPALKAELIYAMPWLAAAIPLVMVGGVFTGVLSSGEEFGKINLVSVFGTVLFQTAPLAAAYALTPRLQVVIPAAVIARAVPVILTGILALRRIDLRLARFDTQRLRRLLSYGGWIMVTNFVGPILTSADQFVVGAHLGATAIAAYNVAYSLAVRLAMVPAALGQTLFPRLSRVGRDEANALTLHAFRSTILLMTLVCLPAILLVRPFIASWITPGFAAIAAPVAELLLIGMWINGLAMLPFVLLRSHGQPDLPAKFHILEVLPYLALLFAAVHWFGLIGAALAWGVRVTIDLALLYRVARLQIVRFPYVWIASAALLAALLVARSQWFDWIGLCLLATASGSLFLWYVLRVDLTLRTWAQSAIQIVRQRLIS